MEKSWNHNNVLSSYRWLVATKSENNTLPTKNIIENKLLNCLKKKSTKAISVTGKEWKYFKNVIGR